MIISSHDQSRLNKKIDQLVSKGKKTREFLVNKTALKLAHEALRQTPAANSAEIAYKLGRDTKRVHSFTRSGVIRRRKKDGSAITKKQHFILEHSLVARVINAR